MGRCILSRLLAVGAFALTAICTPALAQSPPPDRQAAYAKLDAIFADFARERHVPGLVYGVVVDGRLDYVKTLGVQDTETKRPVTADTQFRIASMSKNFTALAALKLRDEGKLSLDATAESVVPELKGWTYLTADAPKIRIRDLATHTAGFVTDDPWGDRQLAMSEGEFSTLLRTGVPFARAPGLAYGYSNFGYALLGRAVTNASGRNYADYIEGEILKPLGMSVSSYDIGKLPVERRAIGYRWQDGAWLEEPALGPGAFGAMGGLSVSANEYARYMAFVLSAWPPREGPESPILKRSSVREIIQGAGFPVNTRRGAPADTCDRARAYGLGMIVYADCELGLTITHSGGLPGYGSNVLMLPERGMGVFAFANLTYAPTVATVRTATLGLVASGAFPARPTADSPALRAAALAVRRIYSTGDVLAARDALAMNFLMDRDAAHRNADLAPLREKLGACQAPGPVTAESALQGSVSFKCEHGTLEAQMLLAPTKVPSLQSLRLSSAP